MRVLLPKDSGLVMENILSVFTHQVEKRCGARVSTQGDDHLTIELALHDGIDPQTGRQLGPATGAPAALDTFEKLLDAYDRQVSYFLELMANSDNTTDGLAGQYGQAPFLSSIIDSLSPELKNTLLEHTEHRT